MGVGFPPKPLHRVVLDFLAGYFMFSNHKASCPGEDVDRWHRQHLEDEGVSGNCSCHSFCSLTVNDGAETVSIEVASWSWNLGAI